MTWVWRRRLDADGDAVGRWARVAESCKRALPKQSGPSLADVREAFRHVRFARPTLSSQPAGGWALVNLDTYYAVRWPTPGAQPAEVVHVRLLGHDVAIRPKVVDYIYDFGDGEQRRTPDPGGTYPSGRVTHLYERTGPVRIAVTAVYSADFGVDGAALRPLDDTVEIAGPARTLTVYQARAQLTAGPHER